MRFRDGQEFDNRLVTTTYAPPDSDSEGHALRGTAE